MNKTLKVLCMLMIMAHMVGCSEDPPSTTPNKDHNNEPGEMGETGGDMAPDLDGDSAPDGDSRPDTDMPTVGPDEAGRLTLQPVSGAGMVRSSKFRAHIQVGRVVDVAPGK